MAARYRTTGCFKFLIFLLFAAPIAYIGASYYHGEDPIANIREAITKVSPADDGASYSNEAELKEEINELRNRIRELEDENRNLRNRLSN